MAIVGPAPVSAKPMDEYSVLVLKNTDAWGSPSVVSTLDGMNITYRVMGSSELGNVTTDELVKTYDMIIIVNDQPQSFYDDIGTQIGKLEDYVRAGRVLEIHAANWGWGGGVWTTPLPRNVTIVQSYSSIDYVVPDNITLHSNYASHGYFANLPADAEIITVQAPTGTPEYSRPSTAVYTLGKGHVSVTGLTIEYSIARNGPEWLEFYREMVLKNLGYSTVAPQKPASPGGFNIMRYSFYYYTQYQRDLKEYNSLYGKAVERGIDNETLGMAAMQNDTASAYYEDAGRYGPVIANFQRMYVFFDLRMAALHQKRAIKILEDAMADR
ncbi:pyrolysin [Thermococcus peptonophilus]|nr:pyrolysin [Thermococcus peptonophilus]